MKSLIPILLIIIGFSSVQAQGVNCTRTASLVRSQAYDIKGRATLNVFDDQSMVLRLSEDFETDRGPDVQIFLATDSIDITNSVFLEDLGAGDGVNHFSGALSINVPPGVDPNQYDYVVFRCFQFAQHWAHGAFDIKCSGEPTDTTGNMMGGSEECMASIAATTAWDTLRTVCAVDGEDDIIPLLNTINVPAGENYAYVFTDEQRHIRFIHLDDEYNFEGSGGQTDYIYGVSYSGELDFEVGEDLLTITASECAIVSDTSIFLRVEKEDCGVTSQCVNTATATTAWVTERRICPTDGFPDRIPLVNNMFIPAGENYAYVLTDTINSIRRVVFTDTLDFEGSGNFAERVYGVSFFGELDWSVGQLVTEISASECAQLSSLDLFLTVYKDSCTGPPFECVETMVSGPGGITSFDVCESDDQPDVLNLFNDRNQLPGDNWAYLITETDNRIKFIERVESYDFENSGSNDFRVWGLSYSGILNAEVADNAADITSTGCLQLSDNFIEINKGVCAPDTTPAGDGTITVTGRIRNISGDPLPNVTITLDGERSVTSDDRGRYAIANVESDESHSITASFDGPALTGVTSTDIVQIQRHILGLRRFESAFQMLAADVNEDDRVSATDLVLMRRVLLGFETSFRTGGTWIFVHDTMDDNPDASIQFEAGASNISGMDLIGVKYGDVTGEAVTE